MAENHPHRNAVLKLVHDEREAAPFLFGYLLVDIPDARLCNALAAWKRHCEDLARVMAEQPEAEIEAFEAISK